MKLDEPPPTNKNQLGDLRAIPGSQGATYSIRFLNGELLFNQPFWNLYPGFMTGCQLYRYTM
jgi:hypothetical protein